MIRLVVDTSTPTLVVGLFDGRRCCAHALHPTEGGHAAYLTSAVDALLDELGWDAAAIQGIVLGAGPGSFTGLRIGFAWAKGFAFARDLPLWVVPTFDAYAMNDALPEGALLAVATDARKGQVYGGIWRAGDALPVVPIQAWSTDAWHACVAAHPVAACAGDAWDRIEGLMIPPEATVLSGAAPEPSWLLGLADARGLGPVDRALAEPLYVRPPDAKLPRLPQRPPWLEDDDDEGDVIRVRKPTD